MKKSMLDHSIDFGVIGLGCFGYALAETLAKAGREVLAIDRDADRVSEIGALVEQAYVAENLDRRTLEEAGIGNCSTVVICIGEHIEASILAALNVIEMGVPRVIAKAVSPEHGRILHKIGAEVVFPEKERAERLALSFLYSDVLERIDLRGDLVIEELRVPRRMVGKSLRGCGIRQKYGLNVIAIIADGGTVVDLTPDTLFEDSSSLVVIGKRDAFTRFERDMFDN